MKHFDDEVKTVLSATPYTKEDFFIIPDENGNYSEWDPENRSYPGCDSPSYWNY